jgi:hypothetical protein
VKNKALSGALLIYLKTNIITVFVKITPEFLIDMWEELTSLMFLWGIFFEE